MTSNRKSQITNRKCEVLPGATLGVLGGGQLGRMFAIAARRMGYRVHVLSPGDDTPTGQVADREIRAGYDDLDAIAAFARDVSVVTFEFENVPSATIDAAARHALVRPGGHVLHTTQHRLREKGALGQAGLPVTSFAPVRHLDELQTALAGLGCPAVLKTAAWGYDGKGQAVIRRVEDAPAAWQSLKTDEAILEAFVDFERELSVVAVRGSDGAFASFGPMDNAHHNHILDVTVCPATVSEAIARQSVEVARAVVEQLDVVGVLCVEFFLTREGELLINECAPRPHNSGHLTIDAHASCQFEQQVRAVCGLPLGSTEQLRPAAMANLLGDIWMADGECQMVDGHTPSVTRHPPSLTPDWRAALAQPDVKLHLYGKREPRVGRKMGHLTAMGHTVEQAKRTVVAARAALACPANQGHAA